MPDNSRVLIPGKVDAFVHHVGGECEVVHFTWDENPRDVGHKALARSLSDCICVSGPVGRAALALDTRARYIPQPKLELGETLRKLGVKCAMDLSDGLSQDLARLCKASNCAAELTDIPIAKGATLQHALHGGEDYELLFTVPKNIKPPAKTYIIGHIAKGPAGHVNYHGQPLPPQGWDHFRPQ